MNEDMTASLYCWDHTMFSVNLMCFSIYESYNQCKQWSLSGTAWLGNEILNDSLWNKQYKSYYEIVYN